MPKAQDIKVPASLQTGIIRRMSRFEDQKELVKFFKEYLEAPRLRGTSFTPTTKMIPIAMDYLQGKISEEYFLKAINRKPNKHPNNRKNQSAYFCTLILKWSYAQK